MHLEEGAKLNGPPRTFPWLASGISVAALAAWWVPGARNVLLYDRSSIANGEVWRLWSGHFAHHSLSHLGWNLAIFLPGAIWLERLAPRTARGFLGIAPLIISAVLWFFDATLQFYAGLSGVTMGVLTLLALVQLRRPFGESRGIWLGLLLLVAVKLVFEFTQPGSAVFAVLPSGIRNVPLAHLGGALCAAAIALVFPARIPGADILSRSQPK